MSTVHRGLDAVLLSWARSFDSRIFPHASAAPQKEYDVTVVEDESSSLPSRLIRSLMNENNSNNDDEWNLVHQRIQSHPHEICVQSDPANMNAYHAVCMGYPPIHIVREMLRFDSQAASAQDCNGETPLHIASYSASEEVQELLVRARPEAAAMVDQYGDTPLHLATRSGASLHIMEEFLFACPEAIHRPNVRKLTPFWLLPRTYIEAESLEEIISEMDEESDTYNHYKDDWDLLILFLRYSYFGRAAKNMTKQQIEDYESWVFHAAAACPACPREVLKFLCRLFPSRQMVCFNDRGYSPLLLATLSEERVDPSDWDEIEDGFRGYVEAFVEGTLLTADKEVSASKELLQLPPRPIYTDIIHQAAQNPSVRESDESIIEILLQWNRRSAGYIDHQGRFPLAHALVSGKSFHSVQSLMAAYPRAVTCRDKPTGLYSFQLAAMHSSDLNTIYSVTRMSSEQIVILTRNLAKQQQQKLQQHQQRVLQHQAIIEPPNKRARWG